MSVSEEQLLAVLAEKFLAGTATAAEQQQLHQLYDKWKDDEEMVVSATQQTELLRVEILQALHERIKGQNNIIPFYKRKLWQLAAAASILIAAAVWLFYYLPTSSSKSAFASNNTHPPTNQRPVVPGKDKATLTLANGTVIDLDSAGAGLITTQNGARVMLQNGKVIYDATHLPTGQAGSPLTTDHAPFNTISTPRGGQYQLILPDGSKVWLNATSAIKFPVAFAGNTRTVELTGEAYFEVAPSTSLRTGAKMPFIVKVKDLDVKVLGTHFNVKAYQDEEETKVTLLEGKVKTSMVNGQWSILKPGEQAFIHHSQLTIHDNVDLEEVISWKNGKFHFNNADIQVIMRQIARWYDVEVEYQHISSDTRLGGIVSRKEDLRQLLDYFEIAGKVRFTVEGRKIIVTNKK
jgi:ferric-dicitrate binding protein FerR (iron transport regulator)